MSLGPRANLLFQEVGSIEPEAGGLGKETTVKTGKSCAFVVGLQQVEA